jgi:hypothetical protein
MLKVEDRVMIRAIPSTRAFLFSDALPPRSRDVSYQEGMEIVQSFYATWVQPGAFRFLDNIRAGFASGVWSVV